MALTRKMREGKIHVFWNGVMKVWRDFYPVPRVKGVEETRKVARNQRGIFRKVVQVVEEERISSLFFRTKYFHSYPLRQIIVAFQNNSYFEVSSIGIAFLEFLENFYLSVVRIVRKTGDYFYYSISFKEKKKEY